MSIQSVTSKLLSHVGYDDASQVLTVRFNRGATYRYHDVPKHAFDELMAADSIGSHYLSKIKPAFNCTKVDE